MNNNSSFPFQEDSAEFTVSFIPTTAETNILPPYVTLQIIVTACLIALVVVFVGIIFLILRKIDSACEHPQPRIDDNSYSSVPSVDTNRTDNRDYGSQLSRDSELYPVIDNHFNATEEPYVWNDTVSDYDNLSLNVALTDNDQMDEPPGYEHPPTYEYAEFSGKHQEV